MIGLVSRSYPPLKRGAFTKAELLSSLFPKDFKSLEITSIDSIEEVRKNYDKLVFFTQSPRMYKGKYNQAVQSKNDLIYIRDEYNLAWYNSTTNGFSYYKDTSIKNFHPIVLSKEYKCSQEDKIVVGIYFRPSIVPDVMDRLLKFLKYNKVHLMVMGEELGITHPNILSANHTLDSEIFFSRITHYYMPMAHKSPDPWPNTLVEAVNSGAQIIIDKIDRTFRDGVDDVTTCIKYHTELTNKYYDNSDSILMMKNWVPYYKYLARNNFEYHTSEYDTFRDWGENELNNF